MDIRLNKLISDSGLCSRREADKYIAEGRVTVNGQIPSIGQRVNKDDIIMLDEVQVKVSKHFWEQVSQKRITPIESNEPEKKKKTNKEQLQVTTSEKNNTSQPKGANGLRPGKYIKYNKYAAARHAAREAGKNPKEVKRAEKINKEVLKEALQPKFGKSLSRSAVAQRLVASPKSASLRKTSRNNPINKAKRISQRNKTKGE